MGFAGAGAADEDGVAPGVEEGAGGEFAHLVGIDRRIDKDERVEVLEDGEPGTADPIADRAGLAVGVHEARTSLSCLGRTKPSGSHPFTLTIHQF